MNNQYTQAALSSVISILMASLIIILVAVIIDCLFQLSCLHIGITKMMGFRLAERNCQPFGELL